MPVAIIDARTSDECERALLLRGFRVVRTAPSKRLGEAVCAHPDMLMFAYNNKIITSVDYCDEAPYLFTDIRELSKEASISFTDVNQEPTYPRDVCFNALVAGDKMFCRKDSIAPALLTLADAEGLRVIDVKQGYPACTVLLLDEHHAISADKGMARALCTEGIEVTEISNGDILLPPHEYGFIGGAAGVYKDTVYFIGDVSTHRDSGKILSACEKANKRVVSLSGDMLLDLGRILFID